MLQKTRGSILLLVLISLHWAGGQTPSSSESPTTPTAPTDGMLMPMESSGSDSGSDLFSGSGSDLVSGSGSDLFSCSFVGNTSFFFEITEEEGDQVVGVLPNTFVDDEDGISYQASKFRISQTDLPFIILSPSGELILQITGALTTLREYFFAVAVFPPSTACLVPEMLFVSVIVFPSSPPVCSSGPSLQFEVTQYDFVIETFAAELNCRSQSPSDTLQYRVSSGSMTTTVTVSENDRDAAVFADFLAIGSHNLQIDVCNGRSGACSETTLSVSVTVNRHPGRLLPFGSSYLDVSRTFADDRAYSILVPRRIPFWNVYYNRIYLSTNGLVSFDRPHTSWYPIPFPYGRRIPVLAPYWTDFDFRNFIPGSALYYHVYEREGSFYDSYTRRTESLLGEFSQRLMDFDGNPEFQPEWMVVATWNQATPYYGRHNQDETVTFQVVLTTDYVNTYAFFLYEEGEINWNIDQRQRQRIVVGYDAKDYVNYLNVQLQNSTDFLTIDTVIGNTGFPGQWYFSLTSPRTENFEGLCLEWAKRQSEDLNDNFAGLPSCPCTRRQAWRDRRFFFAFFWGLSSRPNCATMLFSRRQSSIECCYDSRGSLLVGPTTGGTYQLFNPLFSPRENTVEDRLPYDYCCTFSERCSTYYEYRPSDDCSDYDPPRFSFWWGDPHLRSIDDNPFTFNGIGEYLLLGSRGNNLTVQARFVQFNESAVSTDVRATITTAVAIQHGDSPPIQVQINTESEMLELYVNGSTRDIPDNTTVLIVTEAGAFDMAEFASDGGSMTNPNLVSISSDGDELTISTTSGAAITVSTQMTFLHVSVQVGDEFENDTRGLLGIFNRDSSDDFTLPNGVVLPANLTEEELYFQFGLEWLVDESESVFTYFEPESYDFYNANSTTYVPVFLSDMNVSAAILDACGGDDSCIFDYSVTNDPSIGVSSMVVSMENQETLEIIENRPPNITGVFVLEAELDVTIMEEYVAEDSSGIDQFILVEPPPGFMFVEDGDRRTLVWTPMDINLPSAAIQLFANDTNGTSTARNVSIILCACANNGTCMNLTDVTPEYNSNGHYKLPCICANEFFDGASCEIDTRGCGSDPCPDYAVCEENDTVAVGYVCVLCQEGYFLDAEDKCTDIDECNETTSMVQSNCTQLCINTDGSFECACSEGYTLDSDGLTCSDIDECSDQLDDCQQICNNTEGSYSCDCVSSYSPDPDAPSNCTIRPCTGEPCEGGSSCAVDAGGSSVECICPEGQRCDGVCNGANTTVLMTETQTCINCTGNAYGFACSLTCNCVQGSCDNTVGCICDPGWRGMDCDIEVNDHTPEFVPDTPTAVSVPQDLPTGAMVLQLQATDQDVHPNTGSVSFFLAQSLFPLAENVSDGIGVFDVGQENGVISLLVDLNTTRDTHSLFVLNIEARDNAMIPLSQMLTLTVTPINIILPVPQFSEPEYSVMIPEDHAVNSTILNLTCTESNMGPDPSELTINIISSIGSELFAVEGSSLILIQELDFESLDDPSSPFHMLNVTCTNQYNISNTAQVVIEILNVDDNEFTFENESYSVSIPEDVMRNNSVLIVAAFDADIPDPDSLDYFITPSVADFLIFPRTGEIIVTAPHLDRETLSEYSLTVEAILMVGTVRNNITAEVNITVLDINDNHPRFVDPGIFIQDLTTRNQMGDPVLTVLATDPDLEENGTVTYRLQENSNFAIDETTGLVYVNTSSLEYGSFRLTVYASDGGQPPLSTPAEIDIFVAPSPERVEIRASSTSFNISEDLPRGGRIGFVQADVIDQNSTVDTSLVGEVRYEILNGTDLNSFYINENTGELILLRELDFETVRAHYLQIQASLPNDGLVSPDVEMIRIDLTDVNDNPPLFVPQFYATTVEEFTAVGTSILTVTANDIDSGSNADISYRLDGSFSVPFAVDNSSGRVYVIEQLNTPMDYRFSVIAEDSGSPSETSQAIIFISVVRSASVTPQFTRDHYIFNISEIEGIGSLVGFVMALTEGSNPIAINEYSNLLYRLRIPDANSMMMGAGSGSANDFFIDQTTGEISSLILFDHESQQTYAFYVEVFNDTDSDKPTLDSASVEVRITDENDNAPQFDQPLYTTVIRSSIPADYIVLNVSATDRDTGINQDIDYDLSSDVLGFYIQSDGSILTVNSTQSSGDYHLTAFAVDMGASPMTGRATVFIAVLPATPQNVSFSEEEYNFEICEDASPNTPVGTITALDHLREIIESDVTYSFSDNITDCLFINPSNGEIRVSCTLDRELESRYELVAVAETMSGESGYVKVVVDVLDKNDNAPDFLLDIYAQVIMENYSSEMPVLTVEARDPDLGANGTVTYMLVNESDLLMPMGEDSLVSELFRINETSGEIFLNASISRGDYRLTVVARDQGTPVMESLPAIVLICVTPVQPSGLFLQPPEFSIAENQPTGTIVGTVVVIASGTEIDPMVYSGNLQFSIIGGDSPELFHINRENGTVVTVTPLDREEAGTHVIEVLATFSMFGDINATRSITIRVIDENDEAPLFLPNIYSMVIDDSSVEGETVIPSQAIRVLDLDENQNAEFTFSIDPGTPFDVSPTTGEIFVANTSILLPDDYRFTLTATDRGIVPLTGTAQIFIIVNHAIPQSISFPPLPYNFTLVEHAPADTFIGNVSVVEMTPALDDLIYSIVGGSGDSFFHINSFTGAITSLREVDRETYPELRLTINASLLNFEALFPASTEVIISIEDVNDNRPIFEPSFYTLTIVTTDVRTGVSLLNVTAMDADEGINQELDYSITEVELDGAQAIAPFLIDPSGGIFVDSSLSSGVYHLTITANDRGSPSLFGIAIAVIDVREPVPTAIQFNQSDYTFAISENTPSGSSIGSVHLDGLLPVFQQYLDFNITSIFFSVAPTTGEIRTRAAFDYEQVTTYNFTVGVRLEIPTENPPVSLSEVVDVTVNILDENDNFPQFTDFPESLSYPENRSMEEMVTQIVATDADSGDNSRLQYEIVNTVDNFRIDPDNGRLYVAESLDREDQEEYILNIRVSDMGDPARSIEDSVAFTLLDINDNPPVLTSGSVYQVRERLPTGTEVFSITSEDLDESNFGRVTYSFGGSLTFQDVFEISADTGVVRLLQPLDYELQSSYAVVIRLQDNNPEVPRNPVHMPEFDITVEVVNEPDNIPVFSEVRYESTINPTVEADEILLTVLATDADSDTVMYSILSSEVVEGDSNELPVFAISETGDISSTTQETFTPETIFGLVVQALDNSQFALTATAEVRIEVRPQSLEFTQLTYTLDVSEDTSTGSTLTSLPIETLSISTDITYSIIVTNPSNRNNVFRQQGAGQPEIDIILDLPLDREEVDEYIIEVTAMRPADPATSRPAETATATLTIQVLDVNDNTPFFTDNPSTAFTVNENPGMGEVVGVSNAEDADVGENGRLQFSIPNTALPFDIDTNTGEITVGGNIDYESAQSYQLIVQVSDSAPQNLRHSASITYTVNVGNLNDNFPKFPAFAYFGEVYAGAPANYRIHHVLIRVSDLDDPNNEQQISFRIYLPTGSGLTGYELQVTDREPYYVIAVSIPDSAPTGLVQFMLEVSDGDLETTVSLYLSIFTSEHLLQFFLISVTEDEFLSCANPDTSVCAFRDTLAGIVSVLRGGQISYYNDSVVVSPVDAQRLTVTMYGWVGLDGPRDNNGEIITNVQPNQVIYIEYEGTLQASLPAAVRAGFNQFDFGVDLEDVEPPTTATTEATTATTEATSAPGGGVFSDRILVAIVISGAIAALVLILIIVIVCFFGRRRREQPRQKADEDPYNRDLSQSRGRRGRRHRGTPRRKKSDEMALTAAGSDLAYETMYDDEDVVGTTQTMPWFDPNYLASKPGHHEEAYEGDSEPTPHQTSLQRHGPLRATVDGNARKNRRNSSDDSGGSVTEMDHTQAEYLKRYQQSTPLQPGQKMGEYEMFARPKDPNDPDRPHRPSLHDLQWQQQQQHKTPHT